MCVIQLDPLLRTCGTKQNLFISLEFNRVKLHQCVSFSGTHSFCSWKWRQREKVKIKRWRWWGRWRWRWWQLFSSSADSKWTRSRSCGGTRSWWREGKYIIIIIINTDNRQNITHVLHCWYQNNSRRIYLSLCRSFSFTSWLLPVCGR